MSPDPAGHVCSAQILSAEGQVGAEIQCAIGFSTQKYFYILQKSTLCAYLSSEKGPACMSSKSEN